MRQGIFSFLKSGFRLSILSIGMFIVSLGNAHAQTVLAAGDIAFVGSGSDVGGPHSDYVTFVLLKDIDAATQIIFTDRGWNDTTGFSGVAGDGELTWTSGMARTAGEIVSINLNGTLGGSGAYAIQGDQMFAIQGSIGSPTFIAGLHYNVEPVGATNATPPTTNDANWDETSVNNDESELPNALLNGSTAIRLAMADGSEPDNGQFSCALAGLTLFRVPPHKSELLLMISPIGM